MGRRQCELAGCTKQAVGGGTPYCKAEVVDGVNTIAAPSQLLEAARSTASRMEEASGVKRRAASSQLEATRAPASRTVEAGGASTMAASSPL
jgi:hypothetical protein